MVPQLSEVYLRADCPVSSLFADFVFVFFLRPSPENPSGLGKEVSGPVGSPPNFQAVSDTYFFWCLTEASTIEGSCAYHSDFSLRRQVKWIYCILQR